MLLTIRAEHVSPVQFCGLLFSHLVCVVFRTCFFILSMVPVFVVVSLILSCDQIDILIDSLF